MGWLQRLFRRAQLDRELDKEIRCHIELRVEELTAKGIEPEEAARLARLELGGMEPVKEECRDARGTRWLEDFVQDSRHGLRLLRRSPVFTSIAILSLALGIGANTAIFSLMDRVMLRTLPVREPARLVEIGPCCLSYPLFQELKGLNNLEGLFAYASVRRLDIVLDGETEAAAVDMASGSYYSLLGVLPVVGRTFAEEVDRASGANPVAVISHRYWERRFASDPAVIGKTFRRLDTVFTIIGVTPPDFTGPSVGQEFDITVPITMDAPLRGADSRLDRHTSRWLGAIGRLKPGVRIEQAGAELHAVLTGYKFSPSRLPPEEMWKMRPAGGGFDNLQQRVGKPLTILMGIVALVLLLACANVANLLLTRAAVRQREIAVRLAIGARRGRVIRQLLAEGLLLALAGGAIGVFLAYALADGLVTMISNYGPRIPLDVAPDGRVLLFALGVCVAASTLFSLAPALVATRQGLQPALADIRAARWRLGKGLLVAQMAISVMLLIGAGLFGRTLIKLYSQNLGFDASGVVLFSTNAEGLNYGSQRLHELQTTVLAAVNALPGTESASVSSYTPISSGSWGRPFVVEGASADDKNQKALLTNAVGPGSQEASLLNGVGPGFFRTLRSPLVAGREFNERDASASPRVAIVNQAFAKYYFQDRSPLGRWLATIDKPDQRYEIVGVVQGYKYTSQRRDDPLDMEARLVSRTVYLPAAQLPASGEEANTYLVRTQAPLATVAPAIETILRRFDKRLRTVDLIRLENHVAKSVLQERMLATLAVFFGGLALLLGAIGSYGVMAFQVARRRREIGIRMALGAEPRGVLRMILNQAARVTLLGCVIGVAGGLALARVTEGILYEVRANDPATFAAAMTVVVLVALAAAYLPARSAARINPVETLKVE